jgi:hypothetical protein
METYTYDTIAEPRSSSPVPVQAAKRQNQGGKPVPVGTDFQSPGRRDDQPRPDHFHPHFDNETYEETQIGSSPRLPGKLFIPLFGETQLGDAVNRHEQPRDRDTDGHDEADSEVTKGTVARRQEPVGRASGLSGSQVVQREAGTMTAGTEHANATQNNLQPTQITLSVEGDVEVRITQMAWLLQKKLRSCLRSDCTCQHHLARQVKPKRRRKEDYIVDNPWPENYALNSEYYAMLPHLSFHYKPMHS